ncbi:MAG: glutamyl-tRNA reductase [Gammaproteobacteria bacterium]|nr:glutamyl-tRNA reductase [Gammaproteobacteria bacterium]
MAILAYGLNYRTAPIELRERVAFPEDTLGSALLEVTQAVPSLTEAAIISTCNRTELYCAIEPEREPVLAEWLAAHRAVPVGELQSAIYRYWDQDAANHLIRVAAGLDSQVLGEPQIMGQVKSAYELARNLGAVGSELNLLSQMALNAAKRVRTDTGIGRNPISVAYAAVTMAKQIFSDLTHKRALLLGAGDTIRRVAEHLDEQGIGGMTIANRTIANAEDLAARYSALPTQLSAVPKALRDHDIVIASTGSALPVIGKGAVEAAIRQRRRRPIFMVDIAVPRDIEPEVGELPDVYLYSIDDLSAIVEGNRRQRLLEADSAESLIDQGARRFIAERRVRQGQRMLRQYRENAEDLQAAEVEKALQSLRNGAPPEVVLTRLGESLTRKLIHQPTVALRTASAEGRMDLLEAFKSVYALD